MGPTRKIFFLFFFIYFVAYYLSIFSHIYFVWQEHLSGTSLLLAPILLSGCLLRKLFDARHYYHPLGRPPPLAQNKFNFWHLLVIATLNLCPFSSTQTHLLYAQNFWDSSNKTKLAMLTAWTSSQPSSNVIMDYAPGSSPICIDTGASQSSYLLFK